MSLSVNRPQSFRLQKEIKNYWGCVSLRLYHTYLKDLSLGISSLQYRDDTCQSWCLRYCFMHKYVKKHENTGFGYKKGSKFDSDIGFGSATPKLYMVIFTTFLPKWLEHWKPEGGGKTPFSPPCSFWSDNLRAFFVVRYPLANRKRNSRKSNRKSKIPY